MCLTLYELNRQVRAVVDDSFYEPVWIQAELSSVSERGPHCYLEFVQKSDRGNTFIAKARGQVWGNRWSVVRRYFEETTGQPLSAGMQVMVQVEVTFHEQYGFSLNVIDINPTYTLGDIARRRQEIMRRLEEEGVVNLNKELELPRLVRRVAVISSEGAAGWGDFLNQLRGNAYGLTYEVRLFPAVMQGERVEQTVIDALDCIAAELERWDVVVVVRGGGATSDLTGFDNLRLAENVANFPLPIITGIGHERDDTVIDMISHTRVKTPTAAAEFIIRLGVEQLALIDSLRQSLSDGVLNRMHRERLRLENIVGNLPVLVRLFSTSQGHALTDMSVRLRNSVQTLLDGKRHQLKLSAAQVDSADPARLLKLGFSIVRFNGKAVRDASLLAEGDELEITLEKGTVKSVVKKQ